MALTQKPTHKKSNNAGFTLIELLVVVGIITVTTGIAVAGYNRFTDKQKVEQAARELMSNLKRAQNNAVIGKTSCVSPNTLDGWMADLSAKTYYGRCCTNPPVCTSFTYFPAVSGRPALISGNYTLSPASSIKFYTVIGETNLGSDLTVTVSSASNSRSITITRKGAISLNPNP